MIRRFSTNPIIHPAMDESIGTNINGPSLIRVPDWVPRPLGRYYLYFAHHQGTHIRLAFADELEGPWQIHRPGALRLEQTTFLHHIASPDVHIDHDGRRFVMYYHGCVSEERHGMSGQRSGIAVSSDGLAFADATAAPLGPFYFRVFRYDGFWYALGKRVDSPGGGVLSRSRRWEGPFEAGPWLIPNMRHAALRLRGSRLEVYYSRGEDAPERILRSTIDLTDDWQSWQVGPPEDIVIPETPYEGADLAVTPSRFGAIHERARQVRDPAIFEEAGRTWILYSCAGESGIAGGEIPR